MSLREKIELGVLACLYFLVNLIYATNFRGWVDRSKKKRERPRP